MIEISAPKPHTRPVKGTSMHIDRLDPTITSSGLEPMRITDRYAQLQTADHREFVTLTKEDIVGLLVAIDDEVEKLRLMATDHNRWRDGLSGLKVPTSGIREERARHKAELDALVQACRDEEQGTAREDADDAADVARQHAGDSEVRRMADAWEAK